ncbi:MAG: hypothetical protein ACTHMC_08850 [Pseudobacter sp.]|uniref:hypothetical protein n=1 Tax=Pseudobacter sp. TaxID=2045420 RepID=UPI003F7F8536
MKKWNITLLCLSFLATACLPAFAQPTNAKGWYMRPDVENIEVGWLTKLTFKTPAKPFAQNGWSYPANQIDVTQKVITWMHQTFTCKGLLGEPKLSVLAPEPPLPRTSSSYGFNQAEKENRRALPNTYGAFVKFHHNLVKTSTHKFWPMPGNLAQMTVNIMANNVELISRPLVYLSTPTDYYCVMPQYFPDAKDQNDKAHHKQSYNYRDFTTSPNLKKYQHYFVPGQSLAGNGAFYVVIMTKDNQPLPFEQVTFQEFLSQMEKQLPLMYTTAINNGSKLPNLMEQGKRGLQILKDTYKNNLNDFVYVGDINTPMDMIDLTHLEPNKRISWLATEASTKQQGSEYTRTNFPMLRLKKGVKQACATSGPQWIVYRLDDMIDQADAGNIELMDNFVNRFNYDYVYNYFFGKEKVIEPYKPTGFVSKEDKNNSQSATALSDEATKNAADKSIHFFEDFSSVALGAAPPSWNTERSYETGGKVEVTELKDASGKWLKLKRNASPKNFTPVAGDFDISYDLLVHKGDVPWGTPGMKMEMTFSSGQGDKLYNIDVTPGDMNRKDAAGWAMLMLGGASCTIGNYYSLPDFTGSKPANKVTMSFRKKGETVTVLCNNNKVYDALLRLQQA